jgi:hypothetical protein
MLSIHDADKNTNSLQKIGRKNVGKCQSYAFLNFGRHLGRRHFVSGKKRFFYEICPTRKKLK